MSTAGAVGGLPWTVVRVHRTALIVWGSFVAAVIGFLTWAMGVTADAARAEAFRCLRSDSCEVTATLEYSAILRYTATGLCYSFYAVAAWAGAALIARELESGTAWLAWTQSVSPVRWLTAKLAVPALLITLSGTVLMAAYRWSWSNRPARVIGDWPATTVFVARGPAMVAYALCALAVGAVTGLALRRSLPALSVSFAMMLLLSQCLDRYRADLWPTITRTGAAFYNQPSPVWQLESGVFVHGKRVPDPSYGNCEGTTAEAKRCLAEHGVTGRYSVYHPASHFWPLQLVETGIVLAVTAVATAAAFRLLHRRTA
ncbi:hypothetical protein [Streptomyces sp. NPDC096311]|uniref:hypothetical protein n=1 Tax=Streptomyces sp. NPDC096311 TaxID=3366083 RepID=UPI0037FD31EC